MKSDPPTGWQRWLWPLRSRKMQVALTTIMVTYAAQAGLVLNEETVVTILGVGIALLVLGIALALVSMRLLASSFQTGGPAVLVGSSIMGFRGVALAGAGLYLAVRSLRERGVM